tara:strand:+ start:629 stop:760 length:132 start_codon:yes stop_codon:yes gene_type:complete
MGINQPNIASKVIKIPRKLRQYFGEIIYKKIKEIKLNPITTNV